MAFGVVPGTPRGVCGKLKLSGPNKNRKLPLIVKISFQTVERRRKKQREGEISSRIDLYLPSELAAFPALSFHPSIFKRNPFWKPEQLARQICRCNENNYLTAFALAVRAPGKPKEFRRNETHALFPSLPLIQKETEFSNCCAEFQLLSCGRLGKKADFFFLKKDAYPYNDAKDTMD